MNMTAMTLEDWKKGVATSSHLRPGEEVHFKECTSRGGSVGVNAGIRSSQSVFLGYYFITDPEPRNVGKGWWHE